MDNTKRDQQIAKDFMIGVSVPKLAIKYGLSAPHLNRILDAQNVDRSKRLKCSIEDKIVDRAHEIIGQRLYYFRRFEMFEERIDCAETLGWSAKKLALVEQGHMTLTLRDLQTIAAYMKKLLSQLIEDI